jgi:hypothetical protein
MATFTSTSSENKTATRNTKSFTFTHAVWVAETEANNARGWNLGHKTLDLCCTNWCGSLANAQKIASRFRRDGYRVEIREAFPV